LWSGFDPKSHNFSYIPKLVQLSKQVEFLLLAEINEQPKKKICKQIQSKKNLKKSLYNLIIVYNCSQKHIKLGTSKCLKMH